jgi:predicted nucleic-acid-binding Zn-ribbon protein
MNKIEKCHKCGCSEIGEGIADGYTYMRVPKKYSLVLI